MSALPHKPCMLKLCETMRLLPCWYDVVIRCQPVPTDYSLLIISIVNLSPLLSISCSTAPKLLAMPTAAPIALLTICYGRSRGSRQVVLQGGGLLVLFRTVYCEFVSCTEMVLVRAVRVAMLTKGSVT